MRTAPTPPAAFTVELSPTLLRLRAVAGEIARRRCVALLQQRHTPPPRRVVHRLLPALILAAVLGIAAAGAGWAVFAPASTNIASAPGR